MQRPSYSLFFTLALATLLALTLVTSTTADKSFGCPRKCVPKKLRLRKGFPRFRCPRRYCKKRRCRAVIFKRRGKHGHGRRRRKVRGIKCVPKFIKVSPPPSPSPSSTPSATPSPSNKPCTTTCSKFVRHCRPGCILVRCGPRFPHPYRALVNDKEVLEDEDEEEDDEDLSLDGEMSEHASRHRRRRRRRGRFQCVVKPAPSNPVHMRLDVERDVHKPEDAAVNVAEHDTDSVDEPAEESADKSPFKFWFF